MSGLKRLQDFAVQDEVDRRTEVLWAVVAIAVVAVLVVVVAVFYLRPPGQMQVHAQLDESGGVVAGTEVRVAGIPVGKVTEVTLQPDRVDVRMAVDTSVFIGDQTSLDVRMLTVVGGAYVALHPAGGKALGDKPIPAERVTVPYSLSEVLDAAAGSVGEIDMETMRDVTVDLTDSLDGAPGSVRGIVGDVERLTALLNQQQSQIEATASLGAEYTTELAAQQEILEQMISRIRAVLPVMVGYKDRGILTYDALGEMVLYVGDILGEPYEERLKQPLHQLMASATATKETTEQMNEAITGLKRLVDQLSSLSGNKGVTLDFGDQVLDDTQICIPIAGRSC